MEAVDGLLRDLGPRLQRGSQALVRCEADGARRIASGLADVDALLGGGLPAGRLSEVTGPASSGRTSVAHALLSRATARGEVVAWVDAVGAFDADSAAAAGVVLERTLWVRPPGASEAARCCACLLDARGFALVVLDLAVDGGARTDPFPTATWQRLARQAAGSGTTLLVLSCARATGTCADLVLALHPGGAHFHGASPQGAPLLLEGLSVEARVERHRTGPVQRTASLRLSAGPSRAA